MTALTFMEGDPAVSAGDDKRGRGKPRQGGRSQSGRSQGSRSEGGRSQGGRSQGGRSQGGRSQYGRQGSQERSHDRRNPRTDDRRDGPPRSERERSALMAGGDLPRWLREEVIRTTKKERRDPVLNLLGEAAHAFADGRYPAAKQKLLKAKELSSRVAATRELLGLSCYRMSQWEEALGELRTFRRLAGETTHLAVEMDCLRALGRDRNIENVWNLFQDLGGSRAAESELRVVYGSYLIDKGDAKAAWSITRPQRLTTDAPEWEIRQWFVAARAALVLGDKETAAKLAKAVGKMDGAFPGMVELQAEIDATG